MDTQAPGKPTRFRCSCGDTSPIHRWNHGGFCRSCRKVWRLVACDDCGRWSVADPRTAHARCTGCDAARAGNPALAIPA